MWHALHVIRVSFLTDFASANPGVNHTWIFHVLEKAELPAFIHSVILVHDLLQQHNGC